VQTASFLPIIASTDGQSSTQSGHFTAKMAHVIAAGKNDPRADAAMSQARYPAREHRIVATAQNRSFVESPRFQLNLATSGGLIATRAIKK